MNPTQNPAPATTDGAGYDPFRVLITGSRKWAYTLPIATALNELRHIHGDRLVIVHGACPTGADAIANTWALRTHTRVEKHPADWTLGRRAGPIRNTAMVATRPALCLAFIRDQSAGASQCATAAKAAGIPTRVFTPGGTR